MYIEFLFGFHNQDCHVGAMRDWNFPLPGKIFESLSKHDFEQNKNVGMVCIQSNQKYILQNQSSV